MSLLRLASQSAESNKGLEEHDGIAHLDIIQRIRSHSPKRLHGVLNIRKFTILDSSQY